MTGVNFTSIEPDMNVSTTPFSLTSLVTGNASDNATSCNTEESSMHYDIIYLNRYFTPVLYVLGFPGNTLAFMVWIRPRMRHSSGVYLAALALVDFIFLILQLLYYLHSFWGVNLLDHPVVCESYTVIYLTFQYLPPLLVLAFTIERYISICHPFAREKYCTTKRARLVSITLALISLGICAIQGYFWTSENDECGIREELLEGGSSSFWNIWSLATEMLIFLVVPLCVLIFNIMVIREFKRLSKYEPGQVPGRSQKTSATTIMLLAVSFYLIFTTLPVTIVYVSVLSFGEGPPCESREENPVWRQFYIYLLIRTIIEHIGTTHFALNFYIYFITGKQFRKEFFTMFGSVLGKSLPEKVRTEYTSLRSSFGDSFKKSMTVRLSSNGTPVSRKEANGEETHV